MKRQPFLFGLTGLAMAIALSSALVFNQPTNAQTVTFYCQKYDGMPVTMLRDDRANPTKVLLWYNAFRSSPQRAEQLCNLVSQELQKNSRNNIPYISIGQVAGSRNAMCLTRNSSQGCNSRSKILFYLQPDEDARFIQTQLIPPEVLNQSTGRIHGRMRINILGIPIYSPFN